MIENDHPSPVFTQMIVHLNGWPGVGKQTIGRLLAKRLGARFIHNHVFFDAAAACSDIGDADHWPLYDELRRAGYAVLKRRPAGEAFVMTNAFRLDSPHSVIGWNLVVDLAMARQVPLIPVVLEADADENVRRVTSLERVGHKLADAEELLELRAKGAIQRPAVPELIVLDVTHLAPEVAADRLFAEISALLDKGGLLPATDAHREMHR